MAVRTTRQPEGGVVDFERRLSDGNPAKSATSSKKPELGYPEFPNGARCRRVPQRLGNRGIAGPGNAPVRRRMAGRRRSARAPGK